MAYATPQDLREIHPGAEGVSDVRLAYVLDMSGYEVEKFSELPNPDNFETVPEYELAVTDYEDRAANCELTLAAHLLDTGGYRSNRPSIGQLGAASFDVKGEGVRAIVQRAMGLYYKEEDAMAYVEPIPDG